MWKLHLLCPILFCAASASSTEFKVRVWELPQGDEQSCVCASREDAHAHRSKGVDVSPTKYEGINVFKA